MKTAVNTNKTAFAVLFKKFVVFRRGAGDGIRTRDICLGKATLYH